MDGAPRALHEGNVVRFVVIGTGSFFVGFQEPIVPKGLWGLHPDQLRAIGRFTQQIARMLSQRVVHRNGQSGGTEPGCSLDHGIDAIGWQERTYRIVYQDDLRSGMRGMQRGCNRCLPARATFHDLEFRTLLPRPAILPNFLQEVGASEIGQGILWDSYHDLIDTGILGEEPQRSDKERLSTQMPKLLPLPSHSFATAGGGDEYGRPWM